MFEHLRYLKDDFKDDVPERIIHSYDPDNKYKIRTGWFAGVVADAENLLTEGLLPRGIRREAAEELIERFTSAEFIGQRLNTVEDVQEANRLIRIIIGETSE